MEQHTMISASGFVALIGAIASFGNALPINANNRRTGRPSGAGCTKRSCPFSFTNPNGQCGEVDAAARMPDDIWNNQSAVAAYVGATVKYYNVGDFKLENALCNRAGHIPYGVTDNAAWSSPELMKATCGAVCGCDYPACPDVPDDPSKGQYCSLCGPKFNQPIIVTMFQPGPSSLNECAPTFGLGGSVCVQNPENPISRNYWSTGQNRAACQARCDFMDRGGCCEFSSVPQGQYKVDCYFYPEGSSVTNATFISEQTLPCIQPPPPPPSVCGNGQQRFGPGGNACQTGPNSPEGVNEPTVTWLGLTVAQAFLNCEAEGKTGCCHYRSTTGLTRFIAGGVSVQSQGFPNDMTAACTEPSPPPPRPPALCQAFGSRPGIQCKANPDTTAPDRQPRQWFFIAPEVCFAECEKQGKTGCCDHRTDPSSHGICQFWSGGAPSLRPDPGGQYADMYAGSCIGPSCETGLEFACGSARKEGVFKCGECVAERKDQLTQCSETEEEQFCESNFKK